MIESMCALVSLILTYNLFKNLQKAKSISYYASHHYLADDCTLAIPARNEFENLRNLLPRLIDQRARPKEIIFLDDNSTDGTGALLRAYSQKYPWLRVIQGEKLPHDWRGKVWALDQLLKEVKTNLVMYMDCDVLPLTSTALGSFLSAAENLGSLTGFTSVFPRPRVGFCAGLLVHQVHTYLYYFLPHAPEKLGRGSRNAVAGCGQLMLMPTATLRGLRGYETLKSSTHDGLMMARKFRGLEKPVRVLDGSSVFVSETYKNFKSAFKGFSRNSYEATNSVGVTLLICLITWVVFIMPFIEFKKMSHHPLWLVAWVLMMAGQFKLARSFEFPLSHVLLTPVKAMLSISVYLWGMLRAKLKLATFWRDREVFYQ